MIARLDPASVSRVLRAAGVTTLPSGTRPGVRGVRVTRGALGTVSVEVDLGVQAASERRAALVVEVLTGHGLMVEENPADAALLTVYPGGSQ